MWNFLNYMKSSWVHHLYTVTDHLFDIRSLWLYRSLYTESICVNEAWEDGPRCDGVWQGKAGHIHQTDERADGRPTAQTGESAQAGGNGQSNLPTVIQTWSYFILDGYQNSHQINHTFNEYFNFKLLFTKINPTYCSFKHLDILFIKSINMF